MQIRSYRIAHIVGKFIPYLATELVTLLKGRKGRAENWELISQIVYGSSLGSLKMLVHVKDLKVIMRPFSEDSSIISEIFEQEVYDTLHRPSHDKVVIDVGAHIGCFTLKAAKIVGNGGLIVAIEPHPENFKLLKSNIALFRKSVENPPIILPLNIALGSRDGFATLFLHKGFPGHSSITIRRGRIGIMVPVTTLDKLIVKLGIKRLDFVKIDVEGSEYEVLEGAKKH